MAGVLVGGVNGWASRWCSKRPPDWVSGWCVWASMWCSIRGLLTGLVDGVCQLACGAWLR